MGLVLSHPDAIDDNDDEGEFMFAPSPRNLSIFHAIHLRMWEKVRRDCQENPSVIRTVDDTGITPLHFAIATSGGTAPLSVIDALIDADPGAALRTDGRHGCTPLHYASHHYTENTQAEEVLSTLLQAAPNAVRVRDADGQLPLHAVASVAGTRRLLQSYPEGISVQDNDEHTPISLVTGYCVRFILHGQTLEEIRSKAVIYGPDHNGEHSALITSVNVPGARVMYRSIGDAWDIACVLVQADTANNPNNDSELGPATSLPILHASLSCSACPLRFCSVASWLHRNQLKVADSNGNYPLHLAARLMNEEEWPERVRVTSKLPMIHTARRGQRRYTDTVSWMIDSFVRGFPKAAKEPNKQGRLPLDLMKSNGMTWKSGVVPVLEANPTAVHGMNLDNEVMPKLLSKVGHDCNLCTMFDIVKGMPEMFRDAKALRRSSRKRRRPS